MPSEAKRKEKLPEIVFFMINKKWAQFKLIFDMFF